MTAYGQLGLKPDRQLKDELISNLIWIDHSKHFQDMNDKQGGKPLSISHYDKLKGSGELSGMSKALQNVLKKSMKVKACDLIWTAPKAHMAALQKDASLLRGRLKLARSLELAESELTDGGEEGNEAYGVNKEGLTESTKSHSSFLPCSIKASNDFREITNCVYAITMNPPPDVLNMLADDKAAGLNHQNMVDTYQLNNFLQFIYRGSIRANQKMQLYCIPDRTRASVQTFLEA